MYEDRLYRIKLSNTTETRWLDSYGDLVDEDEAWIYSNDEIADANYTASAIQNTGIYKGYHVEVELIAVRQG